MPQDTRTDRSLTRHTGADGLIKFDPGDGSGAREIPVTNVSWDRDFSMNDTQHNGSLKPTLTTTGIRYTGSFEYDGQNPQVMELMTIDGGNNVEKGRPVRGTLTVKEYNHDDETETVATITFKRVLVENSSKDYPSDGSSSHSYSWQAEDVSITTIES